MMTHGFESSLLFVCLPLSLALVVRRPVRCSPDSQLNVQRFTSPAREPDCRQGCFLQIKVYRLFYETLLYAGVSEGVLTNTVVT